MATQPTYVTLQRPLIVPQEKRTMSKRNNTGSHGLPYCLLPDVSTADARTDCVQMIEETTEYVIASVEVITATKGVLINSALRTAAEAIFTPSHT
jgi:hypothetical protein